MLEIAGERGGTASDLDDVIFLELRQVFPFIGDGLSNFVGSGKVL